MLSIIWLTEYSNFGNSRLFNSPLFSTSNQLCLCVTTLKIIIEIVMFTTITQGIVITSMHPLIGSDSAGENPFFGSTNNNSSVNSGYSKFIILLFIKYVNKSVNQPIFIE